jgi:hypothetical protein
MPGDTVHGLQCSVVIARSAAEFRFAACRPRLSAAVNDKGDDWVGRGGLVYLHPGRDYECAWLLMG